jgi:16S rRNA (adenine1518-N6/adenine1519-N6)-dimethyltransferase
VIPAGTARPAFEDARALLSKYGLRAKKSFGQNFLISERVFRAIVDASVGGEDDWIIEIGSGLGTLTARLAERVPEGKVIAVERDPDMITVLRGELGSVENVEIVAADVMQYDLSMVARWRGQPVTVCGNLPYHVASQVMFRICEARAHVAHAVVMIQREMADRLLSPPGEKAYGAMGVMLQTYLDARLIAKVSAGSFVPAPKVESAVVKLTPLPHRGPRFPISDEVHHGNVVHAAFAQRRKTLRNALLARFSDDEVEHGLRWAEIDGKRRGETLSIEEFARLSQGIHPDARAP